MPCAYWHMSSRAIRWRPDFRRRECRARFKPFAWRGKTENRRFQSWKRLHRKIPRASPRCEAKVRRKEPDLRYNPNLTMGAIPYRVSGMMLDNQEDWTSPVGPRRGLSHFGGCPVLATPAWRFLSWRSRLGGCRFTMMPSRRHLSVMDRVILHPAPSRAPCGTFISQSGTCRDLGFSARRP